MDVRTDPLGKPYWSLNRNQRGLGAALRDDWEPLRALLELAGGESGTKSARMNWEKLSLLGFMSIKQSEEGWVMVKRGPQWKQFDEQYGLAATSEGLWRLELQEGIAEIFADLEAEPLSW